MPAKGYNYCHYHQVEQAKRHEIFPFELKYLVDTQAWIRPLNPQQNPNEEECFCQEPYNAGDIIHNSVKSVKSCDMKRHPTTKEHRGGNTGNDEEVKVLSQIEEAEAHTRILSMITCSKLALGLGQVERAAVCLGVTSNKEHQESDNGRNMSLENKPSVILGFYYARKAHRTRQGHSRRGLVCGWLDREAGTVRIEALVAVVGQCGRGIPVRNYSDRRLVCGAQSVLLLQSR